MFLDDLNNNLKYWCRVVYDFEGEIQIGIPLDISKEIHMEKGFRMLMPLGNFF